MMKQTSPAAKIFSWIFALFWLVVCLLPFTQLISVTFSTADRGIVSTFYPNSLSSGIENLKQALLQTQYVTVNSPDDYLCERDPSSAC